ncbi:MAG TPA: hypothetical protein VNA22_00375 [Pyrinomonadaceae bacterium]|nr:hypothetical protein [Pyrinomonadaceae bacterium]
MTNKANIVRFLSLTLTVLGFILVSGSLSELNAQNRDPFSKPGWARKPEGGKGGKGGVNKPGVPAEMGIPAIEQRIEFYKRIRESAAANGQPIPKVTSVLALGEMSVTGIFRTPRGYAAMVEAEPLRLSYTIYPGEKFFDGQLVAVEENRLVFRRVVKMNNGKFISSVENKPLRKYSDSQTVQGIAPTETTAASTPPPPAPVASQVLGNEKPNSSGPIVSPLDEMNRQPAEPEKEKSKKDSKKSVKVAKSK